MEISSKNSANNDKSLCLYCDKTFANVKDKKNHVEREHKTILCKGKGSRKSIRITKNNSSSENSPFSGCFQCNKKVVRTDDLDSLYQHLLSAHKDVYFGCKCKIRTQDKISLTNHKKNCKIGGGGKTTRYSEENLTDNRKSAKKSETPKNNGDSKSDSFSESEDNVAAAGKTLPTTAIHKKSDRSKLKALSKNASVNDKGKKNKISSSSSTISSSSSSVKTGDDEYTIPLTRQKLKEPPPRQTAALNRSTGNKKTHKTNKINDVKSITTSSPPTKVNRTKINKVVNAPNPEPVETILKNEPVSFEFEEDFYRNISQNIRLNLLHFVDGKSDQLEHRRSVFEKISETACCTTEEKVAIPVHEEEIHESTSFELSTPFPALLTAEQYGFGDSNPNKNKRHVTKNSWKWKWDLIKKYKYVNEGGKIVKKVKQITTGLKDLSQLDLWTQLSMRSRYENLNIQSELTTERFDESKLSTRIIKTQNIEQLNAILDKRLTPEIDIEQLQQTVIKVEPEEQDDNFERFDIDNEIDENEEKSKTFSMLNLTKTNIPKPSKTQLSGEWARPRCYICLHCGLEFDLMKNLNDHKNSEHPYIVSSHYEIVGRENLEKKLYKNLFLPKKALQASGFARSISVNSDSKSNETNEASTSSDNSSKFFGDQKEMECSKCLKMIKYSSDNDIHKHILECIEDRVWMQAKRRNKYRKSRRKCRKNTRKSRLSFDQKKNSSSPSTKDNTEGENSTLSISNPPTPKNDPKISSKANKVESSLSENKILSGKPKDRMSIKNFFKVSKTTLVVPQKVVVQMFETSSNESKSLRSSLRSAKKQAKSDKSQKNIPVKSNEPKNENEQESEICSADIVKESSVDTTSEDVIDPLIPLTICTPEKAASDLQLISPASSTSLISPTSNSNVPKKKKKLNDCIAMLTCKIQEKLGVNFFDSIPNQPATATEEPVTVSEETAKDSTKSATVTEEIAIVSEKPAMVTEEIASISRESATVSEETASEIEKPVMVFKEPASGTKELEPLTEEPTSGTKETTSASSKPLPSSTKLTTEPTSTPSPTPQLPLEIPQPAETKPSSSYQIDSLLKENIFNSPIQDEVIDLSVKKKLSTDEEPKVENKIKESEDSKKQEEEKVNESEIDTVKAISDNKEEEVKEKTKEKVNRKLDEVISEPVLCQEQKKESVPIQCDSKEEEVTVINRKNITKTTKKPKRSTKKAKKANVKVNKSKIKEVEASEEISICESSEFMESVEVEVSKMAEPSVLSLCQPEKELEADKKIEVESLQRAVDKLEPENNAKPENHKHRENKSKPENKVEPENNELKNKSEPEITAQPKSKAETENKSEPKNNEKPENEAVPENKSEPEKKTTKLEIFKNLKSSALKFEKVSETSAIPAEVDMKETALVKPLLNEIESQKICKTSDNFQPETSNFTETSESESSKPAHKSERKTQEAVSKELQKVLIEEMELNDSLKISIPKNRIPNLKEILEQYQVITVNNIKISESERRAFEEQKNRILQILNKSKNLSNKRVIAKKTPVRKPPARRAPTRKITKKKEATPKVKPETPVKEIEKPPVESVVEKIEEAIKTTNRIRCRRLSIVVDPIISLSNFQNKNRKIRLTNNSQQNGFYDLLAASEQFFADSSKAKPNSTLETILEAIKSETETETKPDVISQTEILTKATRVAKTAAKELIANDKLKDVNKKPENVLPQKSKTKAAEKMPPTVETAVVNVSDSATDVQKPLESEKVEIVPKKNGRGKKQNVENISALVPENVLREVEKKIEEVVGELPRTAKRKANGKKKNVLPLEEIKVEQSAKGENIKGSVEKRRKLPRGRVQPAAKDEESLLDISFSSDTSNENDIPLAKLLASEIVKKPEEVLKDEEVKEEIAKNFNEIEKETLVPEPDFEIIKQQTETPNQKSETSRIVAKKPTKKKQETEVKTPEKEVQILFQDISDEPEVTFLHKTSSLIDLSASSDVDDKKSFDPFTINEDSFFNDDLDNDPSDKINDLVNNIINSSEFQIDSDTEKSEIYQTNADGKNELSCTICKRTFRTEKVLEKHCMTSTHKMKVERRKRGIARTKESTDGKVQVQPERPPSPILDETKVFRTKGALKTFDNVAEVSANENLKVVEEVKPVDSITQAQSELTREQKLLNANDDKIYYEFKMEKKPEDMTAKDKDQLFDSLFNSLEAKAEEKKTCYTPKPNFVIPLDSEMESSSTSWDLKHDADIEWEGETAENVPFANAIKERYPKKFPVKVNKLKDTAVSIPTKSLIMGKIFKKHLEREKQKTPQADAPSNKPGIKNSLDEIFDHLKNTAEIDDKVLTCPSPKTLLKNVGGTFSPQSSHSNDMLETASQSNNNNIYKGKTDEKKSKVFAPEPQVLIDSVNEDGDDGIGTRKSRRRCVIKAKTFAETWSSDEYEELHDTEDIISIINEIEKRESIRKRKLSKIDEMNQILKFDCTNEIPDKLSSILKSSETTKSTHVIETLQRIDRKKTVQILDILKTEKSAGLKKRRLSASKDGHKSDEETFTATKDSLPLKAASCIKKRRMSCFVPSTPSFVERSKPKQIVEKLKPRFVQEKSRIAQEKSRFDQEKSRFEQEKSRCVQEKSKFVQEKSKLVQEKSRFVQEKLSKELPLRIEAETLKKFEKTHELFESRPKAPSVKKSDSEKSFKNQKKFANLLNNFGGQVTKKKVQKHRKRPRNKVKNIAYDSDSDFELNLNRKSRAAATTPAPFSESSNSSSENDDEESDVTVTPKPIKSQTIIHSRNSNANDMTIIKEPKLLPTDLKHVVTSTISSTFKAAIPEDILDQSQTAPNRTKRHSSEKLYYWSSSSSESDQEQGDTADGDNEDSVMPHQPEQHGWIVGDSHKKLVTLLAHAKIKNKIN